jgi:hypothetical protein
MNTFLRRTIAGLLLILVALAVTKSHNVHEKRRRALEHRLRNFLNTIQTAKAVLERTDLDDKRVKLVHSSLNAEIVRVTRFIEDYFA